MICELDDHQALDVWLGATRYYLGRRTGSVTSYCDTLIQMWPQLPYLTQGLIRRDVDEAFAKDDKQRTLAPVSSGLYALGDACDREAWSRVRGLWHQEATA